MVQTQISSEVTLKRQLGIKHINILAIVVLHWKVNSTNTCFRAYQVDYITGPAHIIHYLIAWPTSCTTCTWHPKHSVAPTGFSSTSFTDTSAVTVMTTPPSLHSLEIFFIEMVISMKKRYFIKEGSVELPIKKNICFAMCQFFIFSLSSVAIKYLFNLYGLWVSFSLLPTLAITSNIHYVTGPPLLIIYSALAEWRLVLLQQAVM